MAIKGPSLKKEIITTAVVSKDPAALVKSYAYEVARQPDGTFLANVAEVPLINAAHANPIEAQTQLKKAVLAYLSTLPEEERPIPAGIANKAAIDRAKEVPAGIRKAFGKSLQS